MKKRNVLALALAAGLVLGGTSYAEEDTTPAESQFALTKEEKQVKEDVAKNNAPLTDAERPKFKEPGYNLDKNGNVKELTPAEQPSFKFEDSKGNPKNPEFTEAEAPKFQYLENGKEFNNVELNKAEDPFGSANVKKDAPKTSKENNPRYFKSVQEAVAAYPGSTPMYENGRYVVYSDKAPLIGYEFDSVEAATDVFPNLEVEAKNGKYYVYTSQAPLLKYTFDTQEEAFEAFEDLKPMYENGKYVIYTQLAPKVTYEFATAEEALKAFPGAFVEARDGKFYVHTNFEPVEGTVAKKVVGNPTPLKKISSETGEVIEEAKASNKVAGNAKAPVKETKVVAPAKANTNVKTGVAGLTGVVATLAAASAALFKSKRR